MADISDVPDTVINNNYLKLNVFFGFKTIWNDWASFFALLIFIVGDDWAGAGVLGVSFTVVSANHAVT